MLQRRLLLMRGYRHNATPDCSSSGRCRSRNNWDEIKELGRRKGSRRYRGFENGRNVEVSLRVRVWKCEMSWKWYHHDREEGTEYICLQSSYRCYLEVSDAVPRSASKPQQSSQIERPVRRNHCRGGEWHTQLSSRCHSAWPTHLSEQPNKSATCVFIEACVLIEGGLVVLGCIRFGVRVVSQEERRGHLPPKKGMQIVMHVIVKFHFLSNLSSGFEAEFLSCLLNFILLVNDGILKGWVRWSRYCGTEISCIATLSPELWRK